MILNFCNELGINNFIDFVSPTQIIIFGLWKFGKDEDGNIYIQELNEFGTWVETEFTDCKVKLFLDDGFISMSDLNPVYISDMINIEYKLRGWTANFRDAVIVKIKKLYYAKKKLHVHEKQEKLIEYFIKQICSKLNYEDYIFKVYNLHNFFETNFNFNKIRKLLVYIDEQIYIHTFLNFSNKNYAIENFRKYLPTHLSFLRLIDGRDFIMSINKLTFDSKEQFVNHIFFFIKRNQKYSINDINFFLNLDYKSLDILIKDHTNFISWIKFLSNNKKNHFIFNIHLLYKFLIKIGIKNCRLNRNLVKEIFLFFYKKQLLGNNYDLLYSIKENLIENCIDWNKSCTIELNIFMKKIESDIEEIRRRKIINFFLELNNSNQLFFSKSDVICDKTKEIWDNCIIFCGIDRKDSQCIQFTIFQHGERYLLLGGSIGESVCLYMDLLKGSSDNCCCIYLYGERYFNMAMRI